MSKPSFQRIFTLMVILFLSIACSSQALPGLAPTAEQKPATTPTLLSPAPGETRQPKKTQAAQRPSPQVSPSVPGVPVNSEFNFILGRPTSNSITASLYASPDSQISLDYGTAPGNYSLQTPLTSLKAQVPLMIELTQLVPNTTYYYRVVSNGVPSVEHSFTTQRTLGSTFTFTIDADPHNRDARFNGHLYATTLNNALADQPDFHINLGDTFMTEKFKVQTYEEAESSFSDMRPYFGILGMDVPLFLVNGNHEGELGWLLPGGSAGNLPIWSTRLRQLYYPNPVPNGFYSGSSTPDAALGSVRDGYYAWSWGDALFIVLDPYWYTTQKPQSADLNNNWNWTLGKAQYDWLKNTLETSSATYKFVFTHHLVGGSSEGRGGIEFASLFEWGGNAADGSYGFDEQRPGWGKPIHQLLVDNHVSAVFHGHDHVFVKQDLDGIVYQEVPQPSNAEYNKTSLAADYGYTHGDVLGSSGHLRVIVSPEQVTVEYVRAYLPDSGQVNGRVDYSYTIK
jgi:hypothetical protein